LLRILPPFVQGKAPFAQGKAPFVQGKAPFVQGKAQNVKDEKVRSQTSIFEKTTVTNEVAGHFFYLSRNAFRRKFETTNLSRIIEDQLTDKGMSFWPDTISALPARIWSQGTKKKPEMRQKKRRPKQISLWPLLRP